MKVLAFCVAYLRYVCLSEVSIFGVWLLIGPLRECHFQKVGGLLKGHVSLAPLTLQLAVDIERLSHLYSRIFIS